jgi:hypothetical protein
VPGIRHHFRKQCLTVKYEESAWQRTGAAVTDMASALLTVQHQPDTCLSCVSSIGKVGTKCSVGDVPKITRCAGGLDASRLAWEYSQPAPPDGKSLSIEASGKTIFSEHPPPASVAASLNASVASAVQGGGTCVHGISTPFYDLPNLGPNMQPFRGGDEVGCRKLCEQYMPACKSYVFYDRGCHPSPAYSDSLCWLKSGTDGQNSLDCSCMGIMAPDPPMCPTTSIPTAGEGRDSLPAGQTCSEQSR